MPTKIRTPDQRLRVFVSSTLEELEDERAAARNAVERLRLRPVMFELGARPHPPRNLYRAYLEQSDIFLAVYWQRYGWVAPGMDISGLEDEWLSAGSKPRLVYVKRPAPDPDPRLARMLDGMREEGFLSYKAFSTPEELQELIENDLALLLSERFGSPVEVSAAAEEDGAEARPLPADPTPLIGRDDELEELLDLLAGEDLRLVTLTGPGGIGKTRLALEVARRMTERTEVHFVPLAAIASPELLMTTIAGSLGARDSEGVVPEDLVIERLGRGDSLLVLDNFEQLLDAATDVSDLLSACPRLKVVVTSRAVLRVRGEREYEVPPLSVPLRPLSAEDIDRFSAVRLFVQRAREVDPGFEVTDEDAPVLAEICRKLDGLPLAIELAASRVRVLSLPALLERLEDRFKLLTSGQRDLPDRQRTLRDTIDWSHKLLDDNEKALFARLAVFVAGRTLEAAEEVCNPEGVYDALTGITSLVEKSLLKEEPGSGGDVRFTMLESIHAYALEQLAERGELDPMRERHAGYFLVFAENASAQLRGSHQVRWIGRMAEEHDNLRAALSWAQEHDHTLLLRLVAATAAFWVVQGHLREGLRWTERALALAEGQGDLQAEVLRRQGEIAWGMGDRARARATYERCAQLYREAGNEEGLALALRGIGRVDLDEGDYEAARRIYEDSLRLQRKLGLTRNMAETLNNLGLVASLQGEHQRAVELLEECLAIFRDLDDQQGIARGALNLAVAYRDAGDLDRAELQGRSSLELWNALGGKWDIADCLEVLGAVRVDRGLHREGASLLGAAAELRVAIGAPLAPYDEEVLDRVREEARGALGAEGFDAAYDRGRRLTVKAAVRLALEEEPAPA